MPVFTYSAATQEGKIEKGEREAENPKILAQTLKAEGLFLMESKEKGSGGLGGFNINLNEIMSRFRPVSVVDKMFFTRNLSVMISAGLSLTKALDALVQQTSNPKFKNVLAEVNSSVIKGRTFAESLKIHEKVFGILFINMIEVGETTGKLALVLKLLSSQMKKDNTLKKRVRGAMLYPAIIITALFGVGTLMMVYVVPTLTSTLEGLGVPLPLTTRIIILISDLVVHYALWLFIGLAAAVYLFIRALKTKRGKDIFDHIVLKLPVFGILVKKFNTARFCRTMAYLITSGVPIVHSLETTSSVLGNALFKDAVKDASVEIQKGKQLNLILNNYPHIFQPVVVQMIKVGEETGKLADMMLRLALFFEEDVNDTTKNLSTIIEPILMIFIGVIVGIFAVSIMQPIYSSMGNIGG